MTPGALLLYITSFFGLYTSILFLLSFFQNTHCLPAPRTRGLPSVTITVPAYNEQRTLAATLKSLLELDYPAEKLQIIVVDDGSTDRTYPIALKFARVGANSPDLTVIRKEKNSGKADSLNLAMRLARGELFGALDADSFVAPSALRKMVGYFADPNVMAVTPSLKIYHPHTFWQKIQYVEYLLGVYLRKVFSYFGSIHVTPGPFTIFRKSFFETYGPYDTNNLTEDIEVALRIQHHNYSIQNTIDASVHTVGPQSWGALIRQRTRWYLGFINNIIAYKHLFSRKHGNLGLFILPGAFVSIGLAIVLLGYLGYKMLDHAVHLVQNLVAINFDILPWLRFHFDPFFISIDSLTILALIALCSGLLIIYLAKKYSRESGSVSVPYLFYLLVYWVVFAVWWCIALHAKVARKKVSWGKYQA